MGDWRPDPLLEGFEAKTLEFPPDYDGQVVATLVRLPTGNAPRGAVLYVHGFVDYFFQRHMALRFAQEGYAFYALDLRKHGRSLLAQQHPCFCKRIDEYYPEITRSLEEIGQPALLAGHSTGGLVCSLYAAEGERRGQLRALWLNSPFFEFKGRALDRLQLRFAAALGRVLPLLNNPRALSSAYVKSLHRSFDGEWDFDLRLKPVDGFPAYFGWLAAVSRRPRQSACGAGAAVAGAVDALRRGGHGTRLARHRALEPHARPAGERARVPGRTARPGAVARAGARGGFQAALFLGATSHRISSVASA